MAKRRIFRIWLWTDDNVSDLRLEKILKDELKSDLEKVNVEFIGEEGGK